MSKISVTLSTAIKWRIMVDGNIYVHVRNGVLEGSKK